MAKNNESTVTSSAHNVLASGTILKGDICAEENFRIDGAIEGTVTCKGKIVVGPQSVITGNIECVNIEILGTIIGDVRCTDTLVMRSTARMSGNIVIQILEVEPGAKFEGNSSMLKHGQQ